MSKMAVIYWSMTGSTQAMAEAIADGAREAGAQADLFSVDQVTVDQALEYDKLALGCPAMGAEVLEEAEFEPFFTALEGRLGGQAGGPVRLLRLGRRPVDAGLEGPRRRGQRRGLSGRGSDPQRGPRRGGAGPVPGLRRRIRPGLTPPA